jgi:hypothetical protein
MSLTQNAPAILAIHGANKNSAAARKPVFMTPHCTTLSDSGRCNAAGAVSVSAMGVMVQRNQEWQGTTTALNQACLHTDTVPRTASQQQCATGAMDAAACWVDRTIDSGAKAESGESDATVDAAAAVDARYDGLTRRIDGMAAAMGV